MNLSQIDSRSLQYHNLPPLSTDQSRQSPTSPSIKDLKLAIKKTFALPDDSPFAAAASQIAPELRAEPFEENGESRQRERQRMLVTLNPSFFRTRPEKKVHKIDLHSFSIFDRSYPYATTPPFLFSNEASQQRTLEILEQRISKHASAHSNNDLYCGFSSMHNYILIFASRSSYALLLDESTPVRDLHNLTFKVLLTASNRYSFVREIISRMNAEPKKYYRSGHFRTSSATVSRLLDDKLSWLGNDDSFNYIKTMAREGRIFAIRRNLSDTSVFRSIANMIERNGLNLTTLYVSNIGDWLKNTSSPSNKIKFASAADSVRELVNSNTYIIDASYSFSANLEQRVFRAPGYDLMGVRSTTSPYTYYYFLEAHVLAQSNALSVASSTN